MDTFFWIVGGIALFCIWFSFFSKGIFGAMFAPILLPVLFVSISVGIGGLLWHLGLPLWLVVVAGIGFLVFVESCCRVILGPRKPPDKS